jgi:hypothetical protein
MRDVAESLARRDSRIGRSEAKTIAAVLIQSTVGVVDAALEESPARGRRLIELLKLMHVALLERCLGDGRP